MAKRLDIENCAGILVDVQTFFLQQIEAKERERIESGTKLLVNYLTYLRIPILCTVERPLEIKGKMPGAIETALSRGAAIVEKDFFDLSAQPEALEQLETFGRKQLILAGCETDVCVLQSCLGLLTKGFEVFVLEDLLFSSTKDVGSAIERMKQEGAVFMNFKTLFFELIRSVKGSPYSRQLQATYGPLPEILHDI